MTTVNDAFTDADGTLLTAHGSNWGNCRGSMVIESNGVKGNVLNDDVAVRWIGYTPSADHSAQLDIVALATSSYAGVAVRMDTGGASTFYGYYISANNRYFFKYVAGTYTDLQSPAGAGGALNDVLTLEVSGTTITPKRNGVLDSAFTPHTDSSIASGSFGVCAWTNTTTRGDNFVGSDLSAATVEQEGYRWRSDDGTNETDATWRQAQDTADTAAPLDVRRLRVLLNATGDPASKNYQLEYCVQGSGSWHKLVASQPTTPAPTFQAAGTAQTGTAGVTVAWPTHQADDIGLLFIESCGGEAATLTTANGFVAVTNSPSATGATTTGTRITVFWCRATSSSMASPVVADPGDHVYAQILTFRGCIKSGDPWDVTAASQKASASTSCTMPAVTTTINNCLIVLAAARDNDSAAAAFSAQTNANLSSLTERVDAGTTSGNGGGFSVTTGVMATAGSTGTTSATVTSSINAYLTIALKPEPAFTELFLLSASSKIAASAATSTTAQLTAPSGKTSGSDFSAGKISDDTNPITLDLASGKYTEFEWCLVSTASATNQSYDFRVTDGGVALDTYSVTITLTLATGVTLTPSVVTAQGTVVAPTIIRGSIVITPSPVTSQGAIVAPSVVQASMSITPAVVTAQGTVVDPTVIRGSISITPAVSTAQGAVVAPSIVQSSMSITPAVVTAQGTVVDPTVIRGSISITPAVVTGQGAVVAPTIIQSSMSVTPAVATAQGTVVDPTVIRGSITNTPAVATAQGAVVDPTVQAGSSVTLTPAVATAQGTVVDPTVIRGNITNTPAVATAQGAVVAPSTVQASMTFTPAVATAQGAIVDPTVIRGSVSITPAVSTAQGTVVNPTVQAGNSVTVNPTEATAQGAVVDPTVIRGSISITPAVASAQADTLDPTVESGGDIAITPAVASAQSAVVAPTVIKGSITTTPAPSTATGGVVEPTVIRGNISLTPNVATAQGAVVDPTVIRGSISTTPTPSTATGGVVAPTVIKGSISLTASPAAAQSSTVNPTVQAGASVTVTPGVSTATGAVAAPTIELSSTAVVPAAATAQSSTVSPTIITGVGIGVDTIIISEVQPLTLTISEVQPLTLDISLSNPMTLTIGE